MSKEIMLGCVALMALAGCDSVKEQLGLTRHVPDEFAVMQRAPLEMPSNLNTLPVPQLGIPRPQETTAKQQAQMVILGDAEQKADKTSKSESSLLKKMGADKSPATIRQTLAQEANDESVDSRPVVDRILGKDKTENPKHIVDPAAEAKRIINAKKAGKPVTEGKTPTLGD